MRIPKGLLPWGREVPTGALKHKKNFARLTRWTVLQAELKQLDFSSNLSANPCSPMLRLCVLGKLLPLSGSQFAPRQNAGIVRDLSKLPEAGSVKSQGQARTHLALDKCWGNCCGRGERVKTGRFLIVK